MWSIGKRLSITGVIEEATAKLVQELEDEHNEGKPFPARTNELPKRPKG